MRDYDGVTRGGDSNPERSEGRIPATIFGSSALIRVHLRLHSAVQSQNLSFVAPIAIGAAGSSVRGLRLQLNRKSAIGNLKLEVPSPLPLPAPLAIIRLRHEAGRATP